MQKTYERLIFHASTSDIIIIACNSISRGCFLVPRQDEIHDVRLLSPRGAETRPSREGDSATSFCPSENAETHPRRRHALLFTPRRRRIVESACVTRHMYIGLAEATRGVASRRVAVASRRRSSPVKLGNQSTVETCRVRFSLPAGNYGRAPQSLILPLSSFRSSRSSGRLPWETHLHR